MDWNVVSGGSSEAVGSRRAAKRTILALAFASLFTGDVTAQRQMEALGRGIVAIRRENAEVFIAWRLLGTDPEGIAFNVYRTAAGIAPEKLNAEPLGTTTWFVDTKAKLDQANSYFVRPVVGGTEQSPSASHTLPAGAPPRPYLSIPLQTPEGYVSNDASVGDLDGDGEYEIVLHQASRGRDNAQRGETGEPILEAYELDGKLLWRIRLGKNIREGAHYTQFMVYDLDGDGRSEVACKTADGTVDGKGKTIGDASVDHRDRAGYVLDGPEFLTVFDGQTGGALATVDYLPPRERVSAWGDDYGNRVDRFLACVAYLDGKRPSLVMCRGYYTRAVLVSWNWRDGALTKVWVFDSDDGTPGNDAYRGQGNHGLSVGDWREEVVWRTRDNRELRIYTTTIPTPRRMYTLMHDPPYRLSVAWQNVAYNQPTQPGFYLGEDMQQPPRPAIIAR